MNRFQTGIRIEPLERRGRKMKTSAVGVVSAAILMVVVGVGFGIAQAGGTHSEQPVLSFDEMEALEQGSPSSPYAENRPVLAFDESPGPYAESRPVLSFEDQEVTQVATSWHTRGPVETGAMPGAVFEESWMKDYGND